jgi:hypothetical protein
MRRMVAALALGVVVAACTDQPTQPAAAAPQFASVGAEHGAWIVRYSAEDAWCGFWDADGNQGYSVPCTGTFTPGAKGAFHWRYSSDSRVPNATGRAVVFGPANYPQSLADFVTGFLGVEPTAQGELPLCDFNMREYPLAWQEWPFPPGEMEHLVCSTNWHYTLSASGKATLIFDADPQHSWRPFAN